MLGPRLFRNRWTALLWAGGVLWTAYDVADAVPDRGGRTTGAAAGMDATGAVAGVDATGGAVDANDLAVLANVATAE